MRIQNHKSVRAKSSGSWHVVVRRYRSHGSLRGEKNSTRTFYDFNVARQFQRGSERRMNAGLTHKSTIRGGVFHSRKESDLKELVSPDLQAFEKISGWFPEI